MLNAASLPALSSDEQSFIDDLMRDQGGGYRKPVDFTSLRPEDFGGLGGVAALFDDVEDAHVGDGGDDDDDHKEEERKHLFPLPPPPSVPPTVHEEPHEDDDDDDDDDDDGDEDEEDDTLDADLQDDLAKLDSEFRELLPDVVTKSPAPVRRRKKASSARKASASSSSSSASKSNNKDKDLYAQFQNRLSKFADVVDTNTSAHKAADVFMKKVRKKRRGSMYPGDGAGPTRRSPATKKKSGAPRLKRRASVQGTFPGKHPHTGKSAGGGSAGNSANNSRDYDEKTRGRSSNNAANLPSSGKHGENVAPPSYDKDDDDDDDILLKKTPLEQEESIPLLKARLEELEQKAYSSLKELDEEHARRRKLERENQRLLARGGAGNTHKRSASRLARPVPMSGSRGIPVRQMPRPVDTADAEREVERPSLMSPPSLNAGSGMDGTARAQEWQLLMMQKQVVYEKQKQLEQDLRHRDLVIEELCKRIMETEAEQQSGLFGGCCSSRKPDKTKSKSSWWSCSSR